MRFPPLKRCAMYGLTTFVALALVLWLLGVLLLPSMVRGEIDKYGQSIGYKIEVGDVHVAPLLLKAEATDIKLASAADGELLSLKRLALDIKFWPLVAGELHFGTIELASPQIALKQINGKQASWNWIRFINAVSGPADTPPSTMKVAIDLLKIEDGRINIRQGKKQYALGPVSFSLHDYRNAGEDGRVGGLASSYKVNLGKVSIPLAAQDGLADRQLTLNHVSLLGTAHQKANHDYRINLDLLVDSGKIATRWDVDFTTGDIKAHLEADALPVAPFIVLAPTYKPLQTESGSLNASLDLLMTAQQTSLTGSSTVNDLDIRMANSKVTLLGWTQAKVDQITLNLPVSDTQGGLLTIGEITLVAPVSRFEIDAQNTSNFRALFSKPGSTPPAESVKSPGPVFNYDVRAIRLQNGVMHFADESIRPEFAVDVNGLNGYLLGVSNRPNQYASLALDGRVGKSGSLRGRGQVAFDDPRLNNDVALLFKNISLKSINPYTMTFAGYKIDYGRIDVDLHYITKNGQLQGKNRFVIKKIKLGEEVPDYAGARLPLGLAIALLEDSDGMIDVNIPVEGNVNDPEFSVGHLVWQAVKTVLNNLVTAPFRAIGSLLGIENMRQVTFVAGESSLLPADQQSLEKVANVLVKRPGSRVVIQGGYDPAVDSPALAVGMADRAILAAAGIKIDLNEPLPTPNLTDPAIRSAMRTVYANQVGRVKLGQRLIMLPDTPERDQQLRQEIIDSYQIGESQLRQLANDRAKRAQQVMLTAVPELKDRVDVGEPVQVSADGNAVALVVEIQRN